MSRGMSRSVFDELSPSERNEFMKNGGWVFDGNEPPPPPRDTRKPYFISRKLYDSITDGERRKLDLTYQVEIIDG